MNIVGITNGNKWQGKVSVCNIFVSLQKDFRFGFWDFLNDGFSGKNIIEHPNGREVS